MGKYAIYIRVSTKKQGFSGLGLEAQTATCTSYINSKNGELLEIFKDIESGKSRTRKGLNEAINFCKSNDCTLVIAKLDRLARDVEFTFRVINTGIGIHFCDMPQLNTMILGVFASVAQYERELISKRTKDALNAKKERGERWNSERVVTDSAIKASAESRKEKALANKNNLAFYEFITLYQQAHGKITANSDFKIIANELNKWGKRTATGLEFNPNRARVMFYKINELFNNKQ